MATDTRVKMKVFDADGHYLEPPFALPEYIDAAYKDRAPRIIQRDDGKEYWQSNRWAEANPQIGADAASLRRATAVAGLAGIERWNQGQEMSMLHLNYTEMNPAATDPDARLKVMDEERMDAAVLYPTMNLQWISHAGYHHAVNKALNDWLADRYLSRGQGRLFARSTSSPCTTWSGPARRFGAASRTTATRPCSCAHATPTRMPVGLATTTIPCGLRVRNWTWPWLSIPFPPTLCTAPPATST